MIGIIEWIKIVIKVLHIRLLNFLLSFFIVFYSFGQEKAVYKSVNGTLYRVHTVTAGETLYGISKKYNISSGELEKHNPKVNEGLQTGQELLVPTDPNAQAPDTDKAVEQEPKKHKVAAGETLYGISKKYNVSPEDIKKWNGLKDNTISVGQELVVAQTVSKNQNPTPESTENSKKDKKDKENDEEDEEDEDKLSQNEKKEHIVQKGETLYALSRKYNVSVDHIVKWNQLRDMSLKEGQKLIVQSPTQGTENVPNTNAAKDTIASSTAPVEKDETEKQGGIDKKANPDKGQTTKTITDPATQSAPKNHEVDEFVEVVETGVAELIPNTADVRKYLALHRTAEVGTIIRVRNEMNGREIWARVINKLPDTGENKNVLVKISQAAYNQLGALDKKFRVVVTYIP